MVVRVKGIDCVVSIHPYMEGKKTALLRGNDLSVSKELHDAIACGDTVKICIIPLQTEEEILNTPIPITKLEWNNGNSNS